MTVLKNGELYLYGFVGESYWDEGFTASEVIDALLEVGRETDVTVHINSGGGYTDDGVAIYNAFLAHKGRVKIVIDAMAASSASLIAMAGDERVMLAGSMMMIHDPSGVTWGNADEHEKRIEHLNKLADLMAGIYADVCGEPSANLRKDMKATLWMTPEEAIERGFATASANDNSETVSAFDYRIYAHAPDRLVALSNENSWSLEAAMAKKTGASAAVEPAQEGEKPLAKNEPADKTPATNEDKTKVESSQTDTAKAVTAAVSADRQRHTDILALAEAEGREALAETLFLTEMSLEQVQSALAAAPEGKSADTEASDYEDERVQGNGLASPAGKSASNNNPTWGSVLSAAGLKKKGNTHDRV